MNIETEPVDFLNRKCLTFFLDEGKRKLGKMWKNEDDSDVSRLCKHNGLHSQNYFTNFLR